MANDTKRIERQERVLEVLRGQAERGLGFTCGPQDARDLVDYLQGAIALRDAAVARAAWHGLDREQREVADEQAPPARERFSDVPAWCAAMLEEFRLEWVERGRDAARREVSRIVRLTGDARLVAPPNAPGGVRAPNFDVPDEAKDGLYAAERRAAWLEGYDSEACMAQEHGT